MFFNRDLSLLNLLLKYMKNFCLDMTQTHTCMVFSTRILVVLKPHETNGSQVEQYDLNIIDDEEAPCEVLKRMAIGDIRP
jgi:hypothetical protein